MQKMNKHHKENRRRMRKQIWNYGRTGIAIVVAVITAYALIFPAIALENNQADSVQGLYMDASADEGTICGMPEHVHTDECYADVVTGTEEMLVCGLAEDAEHQHDSSCYETIETTERQLMCGLEEHVHDEACYEAADEYADEYIDESADAYAAAGDQEGLFEDEDLTAANAGSEEGISEEGASEDGIYQEGESGAGEEFYEAAESVPGGEALEEDYAGTNSGTDEGTDAEEGVENGAGTDAEAGAETDSGAAAKGAAFDRKLKVEGASYTVRISGTEDCGIPADAQFRAVAISEEAADYGAFKEKAIGSVEEQKNSEENGNNDEAGTSRTSLMPGLFDLTIYDAAGNVIEPAAPVAVSVDFGIDGKDAGLPEGLQPADAYAVHFPGITVQENEDGELAAAFAQDQRRAGSGSDIARAETEVVEAGTPKEGTVSFEAGGFSVYAIVYTVDFHWEVDGKEYKFCIPGGTGVSLKEVLGAIHVVSGGGDAEEDDMDKAETDLSADAFMERMKDVEFSDPELLYVYKVEETITTLGIKQKAELNPEYSALMTRQEIDEADEKEYTAPDWALISLKPFDTEESLKITMTNGDVFTILITDAQTDAIHNGDGTVQTITNPAGTTFDLFDYWISDSRRNSTARAAWPDTLGTIGTGNNSGINSSPNDSTHGHALKFTPANAGSVRDGTLYNGQWNLAAADGGPGVNSWTTNANPRQGLVTGTLVDGYPKLSGNGSLGTTNESLAYLFNTAAHAGKEAYTGVNQLLYVDQEGYYKFDSNDFDAQFNKGSKTFTLRNQTAAVGDARGFWPFGTQVYWHGMHMKTQFSMPANGQVLGPTGRYNDMTFEFQGDDDTWVYVDGVLVGDGGGIHNQTFISINFRDGTVVVDGKHDVKDDYRTDWSQTRYLDDLYRAAGKYDQFEWVDSPTIPGHKTFAPGTYHSFDMFYLERGGGESNLHIRYNLVSTADFTAHKSFHNTSNDRLYRDEFQFEIIGLDGQYKNGVLVDANKRAIMPVGGSASGTGTVASPREVYYEAAGSSPGYTSYITGVSEDGNVNFGKADFDSAEMHDCDEGNPSTYRYIIREVVPDDAVNADGKTWAASTDEEKEEGGYVKDGITYDGKIYYMTATVTSWTEENTPVYGLTKRYYTDSTFETQDSSTRFANFANGYVQPLTLKVNKKSDSGKLLSGAQFSLVRAKHERQYGENDEIVSESWVPRPNALVRTGTTSQGALNFDNLTEGHYILEETAPPAGYAKSDPARWLLTLTKQDSDTKILLIPTIVPLNADGTVQAGAQAQELEVNSSNVFEYEVLNGKIPRGDLVVEKKWLKPDGETEYSLAELEALGVDGTAVTGELRRRATEDAVSPPTVSIYSKLNNESTYLLRWQEQVEPGSTVSFSMAVNGTGYPINKQYTTDTGDPVTETGDRDIYYDYVSGTQIHKSSGHVFALSNVDHDVSIYGEFDSSQASSNNNPRIGFKMVSYTAATGSGQPQIIDQKVGDFTLNRSNNWTVTWTSEQLNEGDYDYEYYLQNVSEPSLEGFTFISDPQVTTNTTTGKATYSVKNIKEGPKTDLVVRKVWGDNLNHSGDSITYKIRRQDFDANGSPVGSPYDYIAAGEQTAATYTLSGSDSYLGVTWQKHHTDLPATNGKEETDPNYRVYTYTAVETGSPANYVADAPFVITDSYQDEHYEVNVIKNNPTDARVTIEKKWLNEEQTAELEDGIPEGAYITGTLKRSYTWQEASGVTVRVYYRRWLNGSQQNPTLEYTYNDVQDGAPFYLWAIDANGNEPKNGVQVNGTRMPQNGPEKSYRVGNNYWKTTRAFVANINGSTNIILDWEYDTGFQTRVFYDVEYTQATGGGQSHNETETVGDFRLDASNEWQWAWTDRELDQDHVYTYFFDNVQEHTADGSVVANFDGFLEPEVGSLTQGADGKWTATIKNVQEPVKAALQLKKQVTINDFAPAHSYVTDKTVADGTYVINVVGKTGTETEGQSYTAKITITNGEAASATLKDNTVPGATDTPVTLTNGVLEIPGMIPGEYTVTEAEDSKTILAAVNSSGDASVTDLENRSVAITLTGGEENVQLITLTNNYADNSETDIAHVSVRKTFAGLKPGMPLPEGFNIRVKVTAIIDGSSQVFNYTLRGEIDTANGVIWNQSVNADGDVVWDWKIAIHGLNPDAQVKVEEVNYSKPGYDVTHTVNPSGNGGDGTSYTGTVSSSTVVQGVASVITDKNSLIFPLRDFGNTATIFVARIVPSQTSLVISKNKLNLSERAALEAQLHSMPNAGDWYNNTVPLYYSFEDAANHKITVRNKSEVTYSETTPRDPSTGQIRFDKKCQWDMVATVTMTYVEGRPADFNFVNSYTEKGVGIDIVKVDKDKRTTKLPGAVFTLTKLDESTTPGHIVYKKADESDELERQDVSDPTDNNGATGFNNLTSGYYEIKETQVPAGYVLQNDGCIYVKVEDGVASYLAVSDDENKVITEWSLIDQTEATDPVQVTIGRADDPTTRNTDETTDTLFSIGNTPGAALPHTGGPGTNPIYICGILLTGLAGAGLMMKRRRRNAA